LRSAASRSIFFNEFIKRSKAAHFILLQCSNLPLRQHAFAVALVHLRNDAAALITRAASSASAQRSAQCQYRLVLADWCRLSIFLFVRRQMMRIAGQEAAQLRRAEFREEDRLAQEQRVAGKAHELRQRIARNKMKALSFN
jgi:signal transduction histidine kinase